MKAAVKSIDITPDIGIPMGGNVREDDKARGTHDNLYCNVIVLEESNNQVCFLGFDLLGLDLKQCKMIKNKIQAKTGIDSRNIVINSTHTHSGPDVLGIFRETEVKSCKAYLDDIVEKVSDQIPLLLNDLKEVNLSIAKSHVYDLSFNRRLIMKDGSMQMNWEDINLDQVLKEAGPIDPELYAILIEDKDNKAMAIMVNFTLHPAVLVGKDWLWSRDYINFLTNCLKDKLGNDTLVLFANGAEGNVNHINYKDKNQGRGFEEAERIGSLLADYVIKALDAKKPLNNKSLKVLHKIIKLPFREITSQAIEWSENILKEQGDFIPSLLDGVPDEIYAREILKLAKINDKYIETEIQVVQIGDALIATFPGEVFVEFGIKVKEGSPISNTMVFGLANDIVGYVPTEVSFSQGGYEIKTAWSSKLDPKAGDILVSEVLDLMKSL